MRLGTAVAALGLALFPLSGSAQAQEMPSYVTDPEFSAAFDMYWRARLLGVYAGSRVCALPNSNYDDPRSPFRPIDERLKRAEARFEKRFPTALNRVNRPYQMPPPSVGECTDTRAAWQSIFGFETAVVGLENLLDRIGAK